MTRSLGLKRTYTPSATPAPSFLPIRFPMSAPTRREFLRRASLGALGLTTLPYGAVRGHADQPGAEPRMEWDEDVQAILRRIRPPVFPERTFRITDFGAREGGTADARAAAREAVGRANAAGGGRVIVPAGVWRMDGPLHLLSNVELHLEPGAVVRFNPDPGLYLPVVLTRWEGTEAFGYSPFVYAYQATNVAVTGGGTLDGQARDTFGSWRDRQGPDQRALRRMGDEGTPVHERVFGEGHYLRPPLLQFFGCANVLIDGPTMTGAPFWVNHLVYCRNATVRNVHVVSDLINNDGVDVDSSVDVLVEDCRFDTGDDGVAIKSGRDRDGWRVGAPSENVVVRRCRMPNALNGIAIGSEMSGGVRNVFVENCRIGRTTSALLFKANLDRGGSVERVRVRDVRVDEAKTFIHFTTAYHSYRGGNVPPRFRDFVLENLYCGRTEVAFQAVGVPSAPLRDIVLRDVTVEEAARSVELGHIRGLYLEGVTIDGQEQVFPSNID